ncbi:hypothetical protein ACQZV8_19870, partial [Magnetococcales bacterium HHB-1]
MSEKQDQEDIQQELRKQQKFTVAGAIGRSAGGAMKGASPIPKREQATQMLSQFVDQNVRDASGALKSILKRRIKANGPTIDQHLDNPLNALIEIIQPILDKTAMLHEFVRQVDVRWGEIYQERPHFQQPG